MGTQLRHLVPALAELAGSRHDVALHALSKLACLSPSRAQRVFSRIVGESPKQYQLRLRLDRAAALLASTDARIVDVAFACGFGSHESLTRSFRSRFGASPSEWRRRHRCALGLDAARIATATSPCVGLYRQPLSHHQPTEERTMTNHSCTIRQLDATPILYREARVPTEEVASALAEALPAVFGYVVENGLEMAGPPLVRYVDRSPAFVTLEAGIPLTKPPAAPPADTGILVGELPAGPAAATQHRGPYETLGEAHAALDRWIDSNDHTPASAPWEVYLTDPAEVPDPNDWLTDVIWPVTP